MDASSLTAYRSWEVQTADRGALLIALYDGALRYAAQAKVAIQSGNIAAKSTSVDGLLSILLEFSRTLNVAAAPGLGAQLFQLYGYFIYRVQEAGMKMAVEPLEEVTGHLEKLRHTWAEAVVRARAEGVI